MGDAGSEQRARPQWAAALIVGVGALLLAWLVIRATLVALAVKQSPEAALAIAPSHPDVLIARALGQASRIGAVDAEVERLARAALVAAPLASEPLRLAALTLHPDDDRAARLMATTLERDPRSRGARQWRLEQSIRRLDHESALDQIERLIVLQPERRDALVGMIAAMAADPASHAAIARAMERHPTWRPQLLLLLNRQKADPALIYRLTQAGEAPVGAVAVATEQSAFLEALIAKGDYQRAYLAWINFLPESALSFVAPVYDGGFQGRPGPAPFNWTLTNSRNGSAEFVTPAGLRADFFGSTKSTLVRQTLLLPPGHFELALVAQGGGNAAGGTLAWTVSCLKDRTMLAELNLTRLEERPTRLATAFDIPEGCAAQQLALVGEPEEFPAPIHATIANLSITRLR